MTRHEDQLRDQLKRGVPGEPPYRTEEEDCASCVDLRAQLTATEREREEQIATMKREIAETMEMVSRVNADLTTERDNLREAVREAATRSRHTQNCHEWLRCGPCNCGLAQWLALPSVQQAVGTEKGPS